MTNLSIDYSYKFDLVMSTDALMLMFFDTPCLDDESIEEVNQLNADWPFGLHLIEYEILPDDYRTVVTVAPYKKAGAFPRKFKAVETSVDKQPMVYTETEYFKPEKYLYAGPYFVWEISIKNRIVQWRYAKYRGSEWLFSEVREADIQNTEEGLEYINFDGTDKRVGTILYLRDFIRY